MTERMLSKYGNYFSGALISCAAIAKNGQAVEGLGGDYSADNGYLDETLGLKKPVDYDQYVSNYTGWLEKIAESNVPMYLVHCLKIIQFLILGQNLLMKQLKHIEMNIN